MNGSLGYKSKGAKFVTSQTNHNFEWPDTTSLRLLTAWNSICINYNAHSRALNIMNNGADVLNNTILEENEMPSSIVTVELGWVNSNNSEVTIVGDKFYGKITDFNIWNHTLSIADMTSIAVDCNEEFLNKWSSHNISLINKTLQTVIKKEDLCQLPENKTKLFSSAIPFYNAFEICSQLGGRIPLPQNLTDINEMVKMSYSNSTFLGEIWLPIVRSKTNHLIWIYTETYAESDNIQVNYLPWASGQPNGAGIDQDCLIVTAHSKAYSDIECQRAYQFSCIIETNETFKLRGLPKNEDGIDLDYIFLGDKIEFEEYTFQGVSGLSNIVYNKSSKIWNLKSEKDDSLIGSYNGSFMFPFGKQEWSMKNHHALKHLKLSKVRI